MIQSWMVYSPYQWFNPRLKHNAQAPMLLNNSSMFILYKALVATSRISFNVSQGSFKTLSSRVTFLSFKAFHKISSNVVRSSPKWHVLVTTPLGIFLCNHLRPGVVQCKSRSSASQQLLLRKAQRNVSNNTVVKFNWARLLELMLPDILLLTGAIVVRNKRDSRA